MNSSASEILETYVNAYYSDILALGHLVRLYGRIGRNMDQYESEVLKLKIAAEFPPEHSWRAPDFKARVSAFLVPSFVERFEGAYDPDGRLEHAIGNTGCLIGNAIREQNLTFDQKAHLIAMLEENDQYDPSRFLKNLPPIFDRALVFIDSHKDQIKPDEGENYSTFRGLVESMLEKVLHANKMRDQIRQVLGLDVVPSSWVSSVPPPSPG